MTKSSADHGLCLAVEMRDDPAWATRVASVLDATRAETLVIYPQAGQPYPAGPTRNLVETAQRMKVAALLVDDLASVRSLGADGVHLTPRDGIVEAYAAARTALGAGAIVGADAGTSRHDAMELGEAGADYVAFGIAAADDDDPERARDTQDDLVAWWSDLFIVPVVAFDIESAQEAAALVAAGADFVAVRLPKAQSPEADTAWAADLVRAVTTSAEAA